MPNTAITGFPDVWGGRSRVTVTEHTGPTSYTAGGEPLSQQKIGGTNLLGLSGFYWIGSAIDYTGTYRVEVLYGGKGVRQSVRLIWTVISTGSEVTPGTNLSGNVVRLLVLGG